MKETWRKLKDFPGYTVSNFGRVKSLRKTISMVYPHGSVTKIYKQRILPGYVKRHPKTNRPVCVLVNLRRDGKAHFVRVHQLVLRAFVGLPEFGHEGCHNDGDPTNNQLSNLRWDSHAANLEDAVKHGTRSKPPVHIGDDHPRAVLTVEKARYIKSITEWRRGMRRHIARELNVPEKIVGDVIAGRTWKHA